MKWEDIFGLGENNLHSVEMGKFPYPYYPWRALYFTTQELFPGLLGNIYL